MLQTLLIIVRTAKWIPQKFCIVQQMSCSCCHLEFLCVLFFFISSQFNHLTGSFKPDMDSVKLESIYFSLINWSLLIVLIKWNCLIFINKWGNIIMQSQLILETIPLCIVVTCTINRWNTGGGIILIIKVSP